MRIRLLRKTNVKIVLMSATLDPKLLTDYFIKFATCGQIPLIECKMRVYPVRVRFLEDLAQRVNFDTQIEFKHDEPALQDEQCELLIRFLDFIDRKVVFGLFYMAPFHFIRPFNHSE